LCSKWFLKQLTFSLNPASKIRLATIMTALVEWTVFALALSWALCTNVALRQHYKNSDRPALPENATAMAQLTSIVVVAAAGYSPLHLLWLLPISYLTGFVALEIRIVGRVAWLYGYVIAYTIPSNW
jgi:hypothetical protein